MCGEPVEGSTAVAADPTLRHKGALTSEQMNLPKQWTFE
jgi:hypothetical protein